jgi:hypothetical protein
MTMRTSTAYFAGVGTVVAAVAAGLGGGYLAANVVSPHEPGVSKLERRMSAAQTAATTAPSEPAVRVVPTTTAAASPQYEAQQTPQASAQPEPRIAASDVAAPAEEKTASAPRPAQPASTKPSDQVSEKEVVTKPAAPLDAFARARDIDIKRAAAEKRRAERRARWEEKRRVRQPSVQELEAVEQRVREVTEPRQAFAAEQVRSGSTQIRLFDLD